MSNYFCEGITELQRDQKEKKPEKGGRKRKEIGRDYKTKRRSKVVEDMVRVLKDYVAAS